MNVYFIQCGEHGPVKIGKAKNVERRLKTMQTGNPKKLYIRVVLNCGSDLAAYEMESNLHRRFKKFRKYGEWFGQVVLRKLKEGSTDEIMDRAITEKMATLG